MNDTEIKEIPTAQPVYRKLVIMTMGGKGGTGKTTFTTGLIEWLQHRGTPIVIRDLDTENKTKGGVKHFYPEAVKIDAHVREALDVFIDILDHEENVMVADMGAGQGAPAAKWFEKLSEQAKEMGLGFLCVGVIVNEPASVASLLQWAKALGNRVKYLVVLNKMNDPDVCFNYWEDAPAAQQFRAQFSPDVMTLSSRPSVLQNHLADHGLSLTVVAEEETEITEMKKTRWVTHAKLLRKELFDAFDAHVRKHLPKSKQQRKK